MRLRTRRGSIYYEEYGSGYPVVLFAPGGMRSSIEFWSKSPFDPTKELASDFRVIAMDQRNCGKSGAAAGPRNDGWNRTRRTTSGCRPSEDIAMSSNGWMHRIFPSASA